ncbi:MAG: glycosyltransferase family 2 protein [Phycisphaerales bacterium]|nr:MAG: glycosyltransferase family 2 protein [Phycisphaerales bacterium]
MIPNLATAPQAVPPWTAGAATGSPSASLSEHAPSLSAALDFSIALATRNRARVLGLTLASLTRLDTGSLRWELVVVDNGSTDYTQLTVRRFATRLPIRYEFEPQPGKSIALNRVAATLRGRLVCFTDDDIIFPPHWMKHAVAWTDRHPAFGAFAGPVSPIWTRSNRAAFLRHPYAPQAYTICDRGDRPHEYPAQSWPPGANTVYRRELLPLPPFDPDLGPVGTTRLIGNDTALAKRLAARGVRILYVPEIRAGHIIQPAQVSPVYLWRRSYQRAKTLAHQGLVAPAPRLAGIPRWMFGELARRAGRLLLGWTGLTRSPRINAEIDLADILGWIAGARRTRHHQGAHP